MDDDTIAAIATPVGEGGVAVIRVSGRRAPAVADICFRPAGKDSLPPSRMATHTIAYGRIVRGEKMVDEVLLAVLRAPRTFTREDTVEIFCHGGILPAKMALDAILEGGARLAEPGEFTRRAFLNGRLDLAQAEAVADLIRSRTELALAAANEQLAGALSRRVNALRDDLLNILAHVEAHIDFPDEDIAPDARGKLLARLEDGAACIAKLLATANEGRILRHGIRAAIIGRPNAGKSSLLNQLLGRERAIVSPIPGTTRDTIEETANVRGLPIVFIDTAGLREARDEIEAEGIRRSRESLAQAELILHVLDAGELPETAGNDSFAGKKRITVRNKMDLDPAWQGHAGAKPRTEAAGADKVVEVSCRTGQGIEELKEAIKETVWSGQITGEMFQVMINSRHQDALNRARAAAQRTMEALRSGASLELVALDLRIAVAAVGEIVGKTATEDLLDSIFSAFCIGK
ncbi:MAG: tRNA uridine-5-carboxymethylaminomethyl(34) synthesis GTPase MnmE [Verrucomicrobia bacterium]|nr:tRNA uridine-5-carboxymethylaminomethyl(34) synthesis GTPase MnmE [Verrucomicrobiota bacterium]MDE3098800.1 tRNA uridine-5-carboxymethylaminomethyl(34) synthesis GTPase MnmE [Verrucomicrobiota bacterium]